MTHIDAISWPRPTRAEPLTAPHVSSIILLGLAPRSSVTHVVDDVQASSAVDVAPKRATIVATL